MRAGKQSHFVLVDLQAELGELVELPMPPGGIAEQESGENPVSGIQPVAGIHPYPDDKGNDEHRDGKEPGVALGSLEGEDGAHHGGGSVISGRGVDADFTGERRR
jgi:hypothetical protein